MAKKRATKQKSKKTVETLTHDESKRPNIPTAELESVVCHEEKSPIRVAYERRNRDLDPQLVWRGKDEKDWSDLVVHAPPLYIQEKVHPKVLIDDLLKQTQQQDGAGQFLQADLFADFNGLTDEARSTDFYQHDANWTNRMILGDSLQVMASLAEREGLRGKVQCIYIDPPYGIKFNSNFQWSTTSRDVKDGKTDHITREPEQVKAFRDTWRDGIHSYLTYLRDRLTVARDLLAPTGSVFVQIGDKNVHRVRGLLDEVFGEDNFFSQVIFRKTTTQAGDGLPGTNDFILWYGKKRESTKFRGLYQPREGFDWVNYDYVLEGVSATRRITKEEKKGLAEIPDGASVYRRSPLTSPDRNETTSVEFRFRGKTYSPGNGHWKTSIAGLENLIKANRLEAYGKTLSYRRFVDDHPVFPMSDTWLDTATGGYADPKVYVVQTIPKVVQRCILMSTDPGDLVLDPTCGSGTTAYVAEQWGRRWITIDTSRVALALARARIMGARYPYYLLADSDEGQKKETELSRGAGFQPAERTAPQAGSLRHFGNIRQGFVYERVPHITLKSIANNAEIDVIWEKYQQTLEPLREQLNAALGRTSPQRHARAGGHPGDGVDSRLRGMDEKIAWEEWEIPRELDEKSFEQSRAPVRKRMRAAPVRKRRSYTPNGGSSALPGKRK